jgi:hypothetical protein
MKRKSLSGLTSDSPPGTVGHDGTSREPLMSLPHRILETELGKHSHNSISSDSRLTTSLPYPASPTQFDPRPDFSPLNSTEFAPFANFDFDIAALNQFLTSGDLDAIINQPMETPQSDATAPPSLRRPYPKASDAIKPAWFNNMEERDLENEAAMLRTTYNSDDLIPDQSEKSDHEAEKIDEVWRHNLNVNLVPQVFNIIGPLPSIDFLVRSGFSG